MKCLVTGVETNNKWKNLPVCTEVIKLAKAMQDEEGFKGCSQRERIIILKQRWDERAKEEAGAN